MVRKSGISWVLVIPAFLLAITASLFVGALYADDNAASAVTPTPATTAERPDAGDHGAGAPDHGLSCEQLFPNPKAPAVCR